MATKTITRILSITGWIISFLLLVSCSSSRVTQEAQIPVATNTQVTPYTPVISPSATPVPSQEPEEKILDITKIISFTPSPAVPMVQSKPIESRYLAIKELGGSIIFVDIMTGEWREFASEGVMPVKILTLQDNGCQLIGKLKDGSIVRLDLSAELIDVLLPANWYQGEGIATNENIAPSGDWIAYIKGYGAQGYSSFEKQALEVMNLSTGKAMQLTEHAGAWEAAWSADSSIIAFSDFDEQNISQIYISRPDGTEKHKVTSFEDKDKRVISLRWSPNGKRVSFTLLDTEEQVTSIGIAYLQQEKSEVKLLPEFINVGNFWWENDDVLVLHAIPLGSNQDALIWFDTEEDQVLSILRASDTPDQGIRSSGFFDQATAGFFSDRGFYTYNSDTSTIEWKFESYFSVVDMIIAPSTFLGESSCK